VSFLHPISYDVRKVPPRHSLSHQVILWNCEDKHVLGGAPFRRKRVGFRPVIFNKIEKSYGRKTSECSSICLKRIRAGFLLFDGLNGDFPCSFVPVQKNIFCGKMLTEQCSRSSIN